MRVTHQLLKNTVLRNAQQNLRRLENYQNMLSSGKVLHRPSDSPVKVARVMGFNATLAQNSQYEKNIDAASSWMGVSEDILANINEILQRSRELAVSGANGASSQPARDAIAMEVEELLEVLVQLGNSSYEGRYVFGGFKTTAAPFERDKSLLEAGMDSSVVYLGDDGSLTWEVAPNVTVEGNINGNDLFLNGEVFHYMENLIADLESGNQAGIDEAIGNLSTAVDHILDKRASLGAILKGLELSSEKYGSENLNLKELRSKLEDVDLAEAAMNFAVMENVYAAAIATGARIIQPSLLDFLR